MPVWSEEQFSLLKELWSEGWSASQIGAQIKMSRNAVIGKVHRTGLTRAKPPAPKRPPRPKGRERPPGVPVTASLPPLPVEVPEPVAGGVGLMDLKGTHCRAVIGLGDDGLARYCGAHKEVASPYCQPHADVYFQRWDK